MEQNRDPKEQPMKLKTWEEALSELQGFIIKSKQEEKQQEEKE